MKATEAYGTPGGKQSTGYNTDAAFGSGGNYRTYQRACGTYEEDAFVYLRKRTTGTTCFSWKKFRFSKSRFLPEP